ncbi:DUF3618 domain-containing protein [Sphingomonas sp. CROZ-RG-20F-R02-07]|uniref:DUF3618 domain-containing protein n=1 Tax=Sphingomonas sp. CROZ-RG-20F-R02-07 TaxID=2914832 RepID=UPI001F5AF872|nr:DUF3618 domain-containing protein [Sphingomonas sp. CROZ-RG-20F-R02-07]
MTLPSPRLIAAEAEAAATRAKFNATLEAVQARLEPRRLARETMREVGDAGGVAAQRGIEVAQRNPGALAGAVAVAGLFLGRHRIAGLFRRKA